MIRWRPLTRVAFRFCVVYLGLYSLVTQFFGGVFLLPGFAVPALGNIWPMRDLTFWTAERMLGVPPPLVYEGNSGDTLFHWIQTLWVLVIAIAATAAWSAIDRREQYVTLHKWLRLYIRFILAAQMFYYGMAKVIPTQFVPPSLVTLVEPVGDLSLSDLLWTFVGSSIPYQMATGWAEMLAGLLLLTPRTTPLGTLICFADMVQVFLLNMTYDFGLKQLSFHLILMSLFVLAPDMRRLANVFVLNRPASASTQPELFQTPRVNRLALVGQIVFGLYLIVMFTNLSLRFYYTEPGAGSPRSPLYGIWNIEEIAIDGEVRPAALNDYDRRWRRVIFDLPSVVAFQRTDDSFIHYGVSIDDNRDTVSLSKGNSRNWRSDFRFRRPARDRLVLEGEMDGYKIRIGLKLQELDTFRLRMSTFRWIRPPSRFAG